MLYFAYGANLNLLNMRRRCPRAVPLRTARAPGFRLVFRRVADIARDADGAVWGALYDLTPACERALDIYEDIPRQYRKTAIAVESGDGPCAAMVYVMNPAAVAPPDAAYFNMIARGYRDWNLDPAALRRARLASLHGAGTQGQTGLLRNP